MFSCYTLTNNIAYLQVSYSENFGNDKPNKYLDDVFHTFEKQLTVAICQCIHEYKIETSVTRDSQYMWITRYKPNMSMHHTVTRLFTFTSVYNLVMMRSITLDTDVILIRSG